MKIPMKHDPIKVGAGTYDLGHLDAFAVSMPGKGIQKDSDLGIIVVFSCHVFTERAKHGEDHHTFDHYETKRVFDPDRYAMSLKLPRLIRSQISTDALTFISRSYGGNDNLILLENEDGQIWTIVFCFLPIGNKESGFHGVRMEILSSHPKSVDQRRILRRNISYFARKCIFDGERTPKL